MGIQVHRKAKLIMYKGVITLHILSCIPVFVFTLLGYYIWEKGNDLSTFPMLYNAENNPYLL